MPYMNNRKITLPKNIKTINGLITYIKTRYDLLYQRDYFLKDRITHKSYHSNIFSGTEQISTLEMVFKLNGGGFVDIIMAPLKIIFKPIVDPLIAIGNAFILMLKILVWIIQFVIWLFRFTIWMLSVFIPALFTDLSGLIKLIVISIFDATIGTVIKVIKRIIGDGIQEDKTNNPAYRCYGPKDDGTLPTTILISTILCPPLGVFMMFGLKGWLYILVSAMLSLAYYIPGLIYALVLFYT